MLELLIASNIVISLITLIYLIILYKKDNNESNKTNKKINNRRLHTTTSSVDFKNILNSRKDAYKNHINKDGLYEPVARNGNYFKERKQLNGRNKR